MVAEIREQFPADAVRAEERGTVGPDADREWVVDPLDGTNNVGAGLPLFAHAVCLRDREGPLLSVVHEPLAGDTYVAERDAGATVDGEPLTAGTDLRLESGTVSLGPGERRYGNTRSCWTESRRHSNPLASGFSRRGHPASTGDCSRGASWKPSSRSTRTCGSSRRGRSSLARRTRASGKTRTARRRRKASGSTPRTRRHETRWSICFSAVGARRRPPVHPTGRRRRADTAARRLSSPRAPRRR